MGLSGGIEIRVVCRRTQESRTIAAFGNILVVTTRSDDPNPLVVNLPIRSTCICSTPDWPREDHLQIPAE
jgi:hypothetical protein